MAELSANSRGPTWYRPCISSLVAIDRASSRVKSRLTTLLSIPVRREVSRIPRPSGVAASASSTRTRRPAVLEVTSDGLSALSGVAPSGRATKELTARSLGRLGVLEPIPLGSGRTSTAAACRAPLEWAGHRLASSAVSGSAGGLPQLQGGDLVRGHHGVPGVAVGGDGNPERFAAPDRLALGDDAGVGDAGGVAFGLLGEPHAAVG